MVKIIHIDGVPTDWVEGIDPKYNRKYYYNRRTRKSTWTVPNFQGQGSLPSEKSGIGYYKRAEKSSLNSPTNESPRKIPSNGQQGRSSANIPNHPRKSSVSKMREIPALQNAWADIEKARVELQREREELSSRMRTEWKLLEAQLEELKALKEAGSFTPKNRPHDDPRNRKHEHEDDSNDDMSVESDEDESDSVGMDDLDKYAEELERRTSEIYKQKDFLWSMEESDEEDISDDDTKNQVEQMKRKHKRRLRRKKNARPDSNTLAMFMDDVEEIKAGMKYVKDENKAKQEAAEQAAGIEEGDFYKIMGVEKNATNSQLRKAYHKLMIFWHPDKNRDNVEEANRKANLVKDAYDCLSNKWERHVYDKIGLEGYLFHVKIIQTFKNYLRSGVKIKKHGRNGKRYGIEALGLTYYSPKRRVLWLDHQGTHICTGPVRILEAVTEKEKSSIKKVKIENITEIKKGISTEVFDRTGIESKAKRYFSLVTPERSLDIEVAARETREFLSTRLSLLVADIQRNEDWLDRHYKAHPPKRKKRRKIKKKKKGAGATRKNRM